MWFQKGKAFTSHVRLGAQILSLIIAVYLYTGCYKPSGAYFNQTLSTEWLLKGGTTVYVYRTDWTGPVSYPVYIDDHEVGKLSQGGYLVLNLQPGQYRLSQQFKDPPVDLDTKSGHSYFVKWECRLSSGWRGKHCDPYFIFVSKDDVPTDIRSCRLMEGNN